MKKTNNGLTAGYLTMMALGTVIGGSFFLGSAVAIKATGPSIILSYILCGIFVYFILFALLLFVILHASNSRILNQIK
ncbi:MAG: hypothetical protein ACERKN_14720, partial [Velocimicrobium sp.]